MNEAYVSFDTAKLLKEKGFDWKCNHYYMENISGDEHYLLPGSIMYGEDYNKRIKLNELGVNINTSSGKISAPTQQMACRWLREEHNILVCILPCEIGAGVMDYTYCIYRVHGDDYYFEPLAQGRIEEAMDYEKILEAGLEYVLKNLI